MNEKAKESLNKAGNICLFVKENSGDEQTARYMSEAIAAINEAVAQETAKVEQPGNDAALREALEGIMENLSTRIELRRGNRVTMPVGEAECLVGYARATLAAPARNCDRFRTEGEAYAEFGRAGNTFGADTAERLYRYVRWLFASEAHDSEIKTYNGPIRNA